MQRFLHQVSLLLAAVLVLSLWVTPAHAYKFEKTLRRGDKGKAVKALQVRVAGWYSDDKFETFHIDGEFGRQTVRAVKAFEKAYGLEADGIAGKSVFRALNRLQDKNGSTEHFNFSEFDQNSNSNCGAQANAYAGTFRGGAVSPERTRMYVRRLMWRLEAVRKKAGGSPIGINSGFRSLPYNDCIGGARASQHLYGTAADQRQAEISNGLQRRIAKRSQFHGIGCYSSQTHNHLDLRIENRDLSSQRNWWWPEKDSRGRDLDAAGVPCWGQSSVSTKVAALRSEVSTSLIPTAEEVESFQSAGEGLLPEGVD
jgi:zinc D-Ala-D-Ala carboxypeptidase